MDDRVPTGPLAAGLVVLVDGGWAALMAITLQTAPRPHRGRL